MCIVAAEYYLIVHVHRILVMTLLENVIMFRVDNNLSSHAENRKNNFLVLGEGPTFAGNGLAEKKFSINFSEVSTKYCLSLHDNADNSYQFVSEKEIFKFKADNNNVNFQAQFCVGSISIGFSATESIEVSSNGNVYDFFCRLEFYL